MGRPSAVPVKGVGFDAKTVHIGITVQENGDQFAAGLGLGVAFGSPKAQAQAVVDDINAKGGLLGRKVVPEYYNAEAGSNPATTTEAACTFWTQDRKVAAVANGAGIIATPQFYACLKKARVPFTSIAFDPTVKESYDEYAPYWYAPSIMDWTRMAPVFAARLNAQGYFSGWDVVRGRPGNAPVKVGLALADTPGYHRVAKEIVAALRAQGVVVTDSVWINFADTSRSAAEAQGAMLKFAGEGVTHAVTIGAELLFYAQAANANGYHPRFTTTSYAVPGALLQVALPSSALAGTVGVGLLPGYDVDSAHDPGPVSPAATRCLSLMRRAGQANTRFAVGNGYLLCDAIRAVVDGFRAGGGLTPEALRAGLLGNAFQASMTFRSHFSLDRFASALVVRDLAYRGECSCFLYPDRRDHRAD